MNNKIEPDRGREGRVGKIILPFRIMAGLFAILFSATAVTVIVKDPGSFDTWFFVACLAIMTVIFGHGAIIGRTPSWLIRLTGWDQLRSSRTQK